MVFFFTLPGTPPTPSARSCTAIGNQSPSSAPPNSVVPSLSSTKSWLSTRGNDEGLRASTPGHASQIPASSARGVASAAPLFALSSA